MAVTKTRGANKKLGDISLGHTITRFKVTNINRQFAIHRDLICSTSNLFKTRFQKNRKALDGECSICSELLNPHERDITFCRAQCGQNVHKDCYEQWRNISNTCPSCRSAWEEETENTVVTVDASLDCNAVDAYIQWLYSGGTADLDNLLQLAQLEQVDILLELLRANSVGFVMSDPVFMTAALNCFLKHWKCAECPTNRPPPTTLLVDLVEKMTPDTAISPASEFFVVRLHVAIVMADSEWFGRHSHAYPVDFVGKMWNVLRVNTMKKLDASPIDQFYRRYMK